MELVSLKRSHSHGCSKETNCTHNSVVSYMFSFSEEVMSLSLLSRCFIISFLSPLSFFHVEMPFKETCEKLEVVRNHHYILE